MEQVNELAQVITLLNNVKNTNISAYPCQKKITRRLKLKRRPEKEKQPKICQYQQWNGISTISCTKTLAEIISSSHPTLENRMNEHNGNRTH